MNLIKVIPISKGILKESLSYFTAKNIPTGSIISVPLRKKKIPAVIVSSEDVKKLKTEIRTSDFKLRKISDDSYSTGFSPAFMEAVEKTADYFATSSGAVLNEVVPKTVLEIIRESNTKDKKAKKKPVAGEKVVLQLEDKERYSTYKNIVRESFAKNTSVFICTPTIKDAEKIIGILNKGIEKYTTILHGSLTKKKTVENWQNALESKHPMLVIGTASFLSLPRDDISTIIIEKENSSYYKRSSRPYIDMRIFAEFVASSERTRFVLSGMPLRTETMWRYYEHEVEELRPLKFRPTASAKQNIVDMKPVVLKEKIPTKKKPFEVLGEELKDKIENNIKKGEHMFIFTARRGIAPSVVCNDCGNTVTCNACDSIVVLHKAPNNNKLMCHHCSTTRSAHERCNVCRSWNLEALGIGIDRVLKEIENKFPKSTVIKIDKDSVTTHRKVEALVEKFYNTKGSILLGTEMVLPYLYKQIENSAVASVDSLLSLPQWRISEKLFSTLIKIRELTSKTFTIQTRKKDSPVLTYAIDGNTADFYKSEISLRKKLKYPPFFTLIKIACAGDPVRLKKEFEKIDKKIGQYELFIYSSPRKKGTKSIMYGLIRVPREKWPDKNLLSVLRSLPPAVAVTIDPENIL